MSDKHVWRFFVDGLSLTEGDECELPEEERHYATAVLRLVEGEAVEVCDGRGVVALGCILKADKRSCRIRFETVKRVAAESPVIHMVIAQPKPAALDEAVSLVSEIGCSVLHIVRTDTCQSKQPIRIDRLRKIVLDSLRIGHSPWEPKIRLWNHLAECGAALSNVTSFFCDESPLYSSAGVQHNHLLSVLQPFVSAQEVALFVGPEASFSEKERLYLRETLKAIPASLGPRILRVPTASAYALSVLQSLFALASDHK